MTKYIAFAFALFTTACALNDDTSSTDRAIIPNSTCTADTDCPTGFECEVEVEHGVTTSFCQAHDAGGSCPAGYELEVEHGQTFCKPHGGDNGGSAGSGTSGSACASDADCSAGLECELEHGAGYCKPHGGN